MKRSIFFALPFLAICAAVYWYFVADRNLYSLENVELGSPAQEAHDRLISQRYLMVHPRKMVEKKPCKAAQSYVYIRASDPTFGYTLTLNEECKVESIARRMRSGP